MEIPKKFGEISFSNHIQIENEITIVSIINKRNKKENDKNNNN
jgi:hypothetical protein